MVLTLAFLLAIGVYSLDAQAPDRALADETTALIEGRLSTAPRFETKFALLEYSLSQVDPSLKGMYCEFGVWGGTTINFIADQIGDLVVHGFDSFEGLPEDWIRGYPKGTFKMNGLPNVRPNVRLYKGWFKDSMPGFVREKKEPAAFLHLDADLYSSTRTVLDLLDDRIVPGTVIQFDEYFGYPG